MTDVVSLSKEKSTALAFPLAILVSAVVLLAWEGSTVLWGLAPVAMALGLRHAFDADHIAGINAVVRNLHEQKKPSHLVGFFFSAGHSSVVLLASLIFVFFGQAVIASHVDGIALFSTVFVALTMTVIAVVNLRALVRSDSPAPHGIITKIAGNSLNQISRQWHMAIVGFLFGLGLDTAVSLIALMSGALLFGNVPVLGAIALVMFFAGAMSFGDSSNTLLMAALYKNTSGSRDRVQQRVQRALTFVVALIAGAVASSLWLELSGASWSENLLASYGGILAAVIALSIFTIRKMFFAKSRI